MDKWFELGMKKRNKEIDDKWNDLAKGSPFKDGEHFRKWVYDRVRAGEVSGQDEQLKNIKPHKDVIKIHKDGSQSSHRLLEMTAEEAQSPACILKKHGYSVNAWDVVDSESRFWGVYSTQDGIQELHSSYVRVKPKALVFSWDAIIDKFKTVPSVTIKRSRRVKSRYLNLPLFDMHFGVNDYKYYKDTQAEIAEVIEKGFKETLFIIGQDMLHNDDFRGRTSKGTQIQQVNMEQAWEDAMLFYLPLIDLAIEHSDKVKVMYSKGNHDESMSWAFVKCLEGRYKQAEFDTRFRERKVHMLGKNFIGVTHSDKKRMENLSENFATEFPLEWSRATTREVFTGHLHHEKVLDKGGLVLRRMPTGNDIDDHHDDHGYTTAHKRFEIFEYTEDKVSTIHYI